jgi:IS1 family transposase
MGIRATARVFGVKPDTILLWLRRAGEHCEKVSAYLMRNLHVEQVQLDELWTFVFKKQKTLSAWEKLHTEYGDTWVWTALDPTHKLVLSLVVGEHEEEQAVNLLQKLKAVIVNGCLPLLISDQLPHYVQAILKVFGRWVQPQRNGCRGRFPNPRLEPTEDLHYATVNKEYQKGTVVSVTTEVVFGSVKEVFNRLKSLGMKKINTSFVERMNLTLRHLVSRLRRRGLTFSKKRQYLKWHLNLAVAYYHLVRPHRGLRQRLPEPIPTKGNGSPKKWDKRTPAMSAELTDHIWSIQELLTFRVPEISPV